MSVSQIEYPYINNLLLLYHVLAVDEISLKMLTKVSIMLILNFQ